MDDISRAVETLRNGGLVAFPTETVYGLGADATNPSAVGAIFNAKGRPSTNPIIVHVSDEQVARRYAADWPVSAAKLAEKFWPGPLTIVVPAAPSIAPAVTAGRNTVGLRAPSHSMALELLRAFDGPIAAPSANRSARISPTTAEHVRQEFGASIDVVLDGGPCQVGIESTVLDLSGEIPQILRPGSITRQQLEAEVGQVDVFAGFVNEAQAAASPGQHAVHYAPSVPAFRFEPSELARVVRWLGERSRGITSILMIGPAPESIANLPRTTVQCLPMSHAEYGRVLYQLLRTADVPENTAIFVEMPPDQYEWTAIRDRLTRATKPLGEL